MLVGYARVSTEDQSLDRQIDQLVAAGVDPRNIYKEKISGKKRQRPELDRMLAELMVGDVVVIAELSRVSRSTKDTLEIIDAIRSRGAAIKSLAETWLDTSSDNPSAQLILTIMAGLVQFERDQTAARVKDGLAAAKKRGRVGGRPSKQNEKAESVRAMAKGGMRICDIVTQTGLSRSTVYRILREHDE